MFDNPFRAKLNLGEDSFVQSTVTVDILSPSPNILENTN